MRFTLAIGLVCLGAAPFACGGTVNTIGGDSGTGSGDGGTFLPHPDAGMTGMDGGGPVDSGPPDVGHPMVPYPAPHPPMPQVQNVGGNVISNPKIVAVTFSNDDPAFVMEGEDFVSKVGATTYWTAAVSEYGINAATAGTPIRLTEAAPAMIDDATIQTWLAGKFGTDPNFPATPDVSTIYALFYPSTTQITLQGMGSCQTFGGYHNETAVGSTPVSYAVVPRCSAQGQPGLPTTQAVMTGSASHELIEAVTDPRPQTNPAYGQVDLDHLIWEFIVGGGEVGDMCAQNPGAFFPDPEMNYYVQRTWSNKAALGSHDPCAPAPMGQSYFNSAPVLNDSVTVNAMGQTITTKGVSIPVGQSKTVELDLYSDGPTAGPWSVKAIDGATLMGGGSNLTFSYDHTSGQNGDKIMMTIKVTSASSFNAEAFLLVSQLGNQASLWVGLVGN